MSGQIKINLESVKDLPDLVRRLSVGLGRLSPVINTTESTGDTNAEDIAANTTDIIANIVDIETNATDIATNTTNIGTNDTDIATNATNIATNVTNVATNATNIATNVTNVATNATNISSNDTDITNRARLISITSQVEAAAWTPQKGDIVTITAADSIDLTSKNIQYCTIINSIDMEDLEDEPGEERTLSFQDISYSRIIHTGEVSTHWMHGTSYIFFTGGGTASGVTIDHHHQASTWVTYRYPTVEETNYTAFYGCTFNISQALVIGNTRMTNDILFDYCVFNCPTYVYSSGSFYGLKNSVFENCIFMDDVNISGSTDPGGANETYFNECILIKALNYSGGATTANVNYSAFLEQLTVEISSPSDGDILVYESSSGLWKNEAP